MGLESSFTLLREIGILELTDQEEVHFSIDAYHGYRYISVRKYIKTDQLSMPTTGGVTLTPQIVRVLVPRLLALPEDEKQLSLGPVGKFAKRPGICLVVTIAAMGNARGLDIRQWEQDKGYTKKGIFLPLVKWTEIRQLFTNTLSAVDEIPDVNF